MTNIYAALEIGTSRTVMAVGEAKTGERLRVTCHADIPSTGVRKSQILDMNQATQSIRSVLREIERKQRETGDSLTIGNAFLVVSGQHIRIDPFQGTAQVEGQRVTNADIEEVFRSSRNITLPKDREILDIVDQSYELDSLSGIVSPKGMNGRILKLDTLQIHTDKNLVDNARGAAAEAHLELRDPLFAATCAAEAVLSDSERRNGVLVLDLGGGSTGWAAYTNGYLAAADVIGVGGDHVTNDISYAFQTTQAQAEMLKRNDASAVLSSAAGMSQRVSLFGSSPLMEARTVSRRSLDTVVNLRLKELFTIIRNDLERKDLLHRLNAGAVITGGGAAMHGIGDLIRRELGIPVRFGIPGNVDGFDGTERAESFAAIAGALLYAHRNYEEKSFLSTLIGKVFKK